MPSTTLLWSRGLATTPNLTADDERRATSGLVSAGPVIHPRAAAGSAGLAPTARLPVTLSSAGSAALAPAVAPPVPPRVAIGGATTAPILPSLRPVPLDAGASFESRLPRRVALFTETFLPRVDGIVNTLCWTLRGLVEAGCEPLVVAPRGNTALLPGVKVIGASSLPFPLYPEVRLALMGPGIGQQLDEFQPDVIHLVGPVVNGVGGLLYAQRRGIPVLASFHTNLAHYARHYSLGWLEAWIWRALRTVHNRCALTLCPSHALLDDLRGHGFERLRYWSRGVDTEQFSPERASSSWRRELGVADDATLLLYVGRLAREKRVADLAPVLRRLTESGGPSGSRARPVHLAMVGDGPARAELAQAFSGLPVSFTGYLRGEALARAYASSDLFVFPSDSEAFGNVVLEAMASGLPVVAAAAGGVEDLVDHESTGLLFSPTSLVGLEDGIRQYLDDPATRRRHGQAGRSAALARTWSRQQRLLLAHYAAVAGDTHRPGRGVAAR
jgi:glycosyltransferase involved in cell wall biosynthesis